MNFEKVIEDLTVKNDIYNLSANALCYKYGDDGALFSKFLQNFSSMLVGKSIYPIMILDEYDKIESLLIHSYGNYEHIALYKLIMDELNTNRRRCYDEDDKGQADYLFKESIGYTKTKENMKSKDLIAGMLECAENLSREGSLSKAEILDYLDKNHPQVENRKMIVESLNDFYVKHCSIYTRIDEQYLNSLLPKYKLLDSDMVYANYKEINPKISLCYNMNFLFLANYMMTLHKDCCTEEFLDLIKEVVDISTSLEELKPSEFDRYNYLRVAKFTLKNVNKLAKKSESKNKKMTKIKK